MLELYRLGIYSILVRGGGGGNVDGLLALCVGDVCPRGDGCAPANADAKYGEDGSYNFSASYGVGGSARWSAFVGAGVNAAEGAERDLRL